MSGHDCNKSSYNVTLSHLRSKGIPVYIYHIALALKCKQTYTHLSAQYHDIAYLVVILVMGDILILILYQYTVYVESFVGQKFRGFTSDRESFPTKVWTRVHNFLVIEMALLKYLEKRSTMAPQNH